MDINEYKDKKAKGLAVIIVVGGGYAIVTKQYSRDDGNEIAPEIESIDLTALTIKKAKLQVEIDDCAEAITDIETLHINGDIINGDVIIWP